MTTPLVSFGPSAPVASSCVPRRSPSYLRVVVTTACNLRCSYCHAEGDRQRGDEARGLPGPVLGELLEIALKAGIRKVKLLGGEPLARRDLTDVVRTAHAACPSADISAITAGVVQPHLVNDLLAAGLSRINVSIHGFTPEALAQRIRGPGAHARRSAFLEAVIASGRPVKLNYVYAGRACEPDLSALLDWAVPRRLCVNVLDDLHGDGGVEALMEVLGRLRGKPDRTELVPDPDSLETLHWLWDDGLRVELKHNHLGEAAPWRACDTCQARPRCREGIVALRLTHDGRLLPCMDRPELGIPIAPILERQGHDAALAAWRRFVEEV